MPPTIPVFMEVRPFQVSNLCFEVGGILGESRVELGTEVAAFDFDTLYTDFRNAEPPGELALGGGKNGLTFDSTEIDRVTRAGVINPKNLPEPRRAALANLRAESLRAALDKAIHVRANAFITKFGGVAAIADVMRKVIPLRGLSINHLSELSFDMTKDLEAAYVGDKERTDVVTSTINSSDTKDPTGTTTEKQTVTTKNVDFRFPRIENQARNERAQISLGQEVISFVSAPFPGSYRRRLSDRAASANCGIREGCGANNWAEVR